jgi:hypothetical protein
MQEKKFPTLTTIPARSGRDDGRKNVTSEATAIEAILKAEESKITFKKNRELLGRTNTPLTQVDILSDPMSPTSPLLTVSNKSEVESQILSRNRKHSLQAHSTPFLHNKTLSKLIDPFNECNGFDDLNGSFVE